jgi:glycosyltransferase involved in cell wall biosynthesis
MRLGGFVIHSDAVGTISPCFDSLAAVCDQLVTVDTGSTDGTAALATSKGFTVLRRPWEGYGAARLEAVKALDDCNWVLFLDSDEWLGPEAIEAIRRLKLSPPDAPCVSLARRNWAELGSRRFVYQHEHPVRLARREHARFDRRMIVHEAVPPGPTVSLDAVIEHRYVTSIEGLRAKVGRYALLWALRQQFEEKRPRSPTLQWTLHMFRDLLLRGAAFGGPPEAFQIAAVFADYHAWKYELLREVRAGGYATLVNLLREDRLEELFQALPAAIEHELKPWAPWAVRLPDRLF